MTRRDLLQLVEKAFPFVPRPPESEISFHQDECAHCEMSREGLMKYPGTATKLPEAAIRFVYDEWTTLSAKSAAWIFPSYLRSVLTNEDEDKDYPPQTIEWLIYSLRPIANEADEIRMRLSLLTLEQVAILLAMLEYWKKDASWREYCAEEIDAAIAFISTRNRRAGMSRLFDDAAPPTGAIGRPSPQPREQVASSAWFLSKVASNAEVQSDRRAWLPEQRRENNYSTRLGDVAGAVGHRSRGSAGPAQGLPTN